MANDGLGDKIEGAADRTLGNAQQGIGRATGDADMVDRGEANEAEGRGEQALGGLKDAAGNVGEGLRDAGRNIGNAVEDMTDGRR